MENYLLCQQWASKISAEKAFSEIEKLKAKYPWLRCEETHLFLTQMRQDLPKILNIIKLQEKQNAVLREKNRRNDAYIKANGLMDELIINDIRDKFGIDL